MSDLTSQIEAALSKVVDPEIHRPITELNMVDEIRVEQSGVFVRVLLTVAHCPMRNRIEEDVKAALLSVPGIPHFTLELGAMNDEQRAALTQQLRGGEPAHEIPFSQPGNLTQVIAIASGKGGVGKSSLTVNLALALAKQGKNVGLLDADIYGHSIPDMLGIGDESPTAVDSMIMPVPAYGIRAISIGMLKPSRDAVIAWRGPVLDRALTQLLSDVYWGDLDYLLIDLPPGTGDIALSLGQKLPNSEVIVVTTPQLAASEVAERAGTMANMMKQRILGVVENMSYLETKCPHCDQLHRVELFGSGGGQAVARALTVRFGTEVGLLAQIPLETELRTGGDVGVPIVESDPEAPSAKAIIGLAERIAARPRNLVGQSLKLSVD